MRNNSVKLYFEFRPVVQEEIFKKLFYLELLQPVCSAEQNHCAILVEGITRNISV